MFIPQYLIISNAKFSRLNASIQLNCVYWVSITNHHYSSKQIRLNNEYPVLDPLRFWSLRHIEYILLQNNLIWYYYEQHSNFKLRAGITPWLKGSHRSSTIRVHKYYIRQHIPVSLLHVKGLKEPCQFLSCHISLVRYALLKTLS